MIYELPKLTGSDSCILFDTLTPNIKVQAVSEKNSTNPVCLIAMVILYKCIEMNPVKADKVIKPANYR